MCYTFFSFIVSKSLQLCTAHAKQSTIVLRWKNNAQVQYFYMECDDSDGIATYNYQNWPGENQPAGVIDRIHSLDEHYERRIVYC